jgi:hypothetical protein
MEKVLIVSQTCPKCYSLVNNILQRNLIQTLLDNKIYLVYYNDYLEHGRILMDAAVSYMESLDSDRYKGIPQVTPVLVERNSNFSEIRTLAVGEMGILEYLNTLQ